MFLPPGQYFHSNVLGFPRLRVKVYATFIKNIRSSERASELRARKDSPWVVFSKGWFCTRLHFSIDFCFRLLASGWKFGYRRSKYLFHDPTYRDSFQCPTLVLWPAFPGEAGIFFDWRINHEMYAKGKKKKNFVGEVGGALTRRATTTFRSDFVYLNNSHSRDVHLRFLNASQGLTVWLAYCTRSALVWRITKPRVFQQPWASFSSL